MKKLEKEFKVKFRGIRGSHPVSANNKLKYGGNTACVELQINGHTIIIDAGTGIIELGNDLVKSHIASGADISTRKPIKTVILFSHSHMDHIQGLPFFKPNYIKSSKLYLFGEQKQGKDFQEFIADSVFKLMFPVELDEVAADIKINNLNETNAIILNPDSSEPEIISFNSEEQIKAHENAVIITCIKSNTHPKEGVNIFKIKCNDKILVYATDTETYPGIDIKLIDFARGANLLIHDAQYTMEDYNSHVSPKYGFGHSTPEMAIEIAKNAKVSQLVLYHLDPSYDDNFIEKLEEKVKGIFNNAIFAYENLEIDLMQVKCKS